MMRFQPMPSLNTTLIAALVALSLPALAGADGPGAAPQGDASQGATIAEHEAVKTFPETSVAAAQPGEAIAWRPPVQGTTFESVGAGARGDQSLPNPTAVVPSADEGARQSVGLTHQEAPAVFWHLDAPGPEGVRFFFTLLEPAADELVVEFEVDRPERSGIQRVSLAEHGVRLDRDKVYHWSLAMVPDGDQRSCDVVISGAVRRVEWPTAAPGTARAFAHSGLWYDALDAANRSERNELLRQAGFAFSGS